MKIRITEPGLYGAEGEIPVGAEFDFAQPPLEWMGRYIEIGEGDKTSIKTSDKEAALENLQTGQIQDDLTDKPADELKVIAKNEKIDLGAATAPGDIMAVIRKERDARKQ